MSIMLKQTVKSAPSQPLSISEGKWAKNVNVTYIKIIMYLMIILLKAIKPMSVLWYLIIAKMPMSVLCK